MRNFAVFIGLIVKLLFYRHKGGVSFPTYGGASVRLLPFNRNCCRKMLTEEEEEEED
jgi:hypothetical protein